MRQDMERFGNVSDIDLKEQCGMVDLNCTALTRMTGSACHICGKAAGLSIWLGQLRSVHSQDSVYMRLPKHMYCVFHRDWQQN